MFERRNSLQVLKVAAFAGASALFMGACVSPDTSSNLTQVTPQGTVPIENIRAGMPESIFTSARITFAVDTHQAASNGGKNQYISRTYNAKQGQYVAQCKDNKCYELQVLYKPPVAKTDALALLPQMMPVDAGAETAVDDSVLKDKKNLRNIEFHYFGNKALAIVTYADKSGTTIDSINAYAMAPQKALKFEYGKVPTSLVIPAESKSPAVALKQGKGAADGAAH